MLEEVEKQEEKPETEKIPVGEEITKAIEALPPETQRAVTTAMVAKHLEKMLREGEVSLPEAILWASYLESKGKGEEKKEKMSWAEVLLFDSWLERKYRSQPQIDPEALTAKIISKLKEEGLISTSQPKQPDEMPEWAKELQRQQHEILERLSREEQVKKEHELIQKAQEPIKAELEKERLKQEAQQKELQKQIEMIQAQLQQLSQVFQQMTTEGKDKQSPNPLKVIKETLTEIKETGKLIGLKEPEEVKSSSSNFEGIPVSGSVPAWAVAIPKIVQSIFAEIEKRAELWLKPSQEKLIKVPLPPVEFQPPQPLIKLPKQPVAEKVELMPPPPPPPPKEVKMEVTPPKLKKYQCKECLAEFEKPYQLAAHVKKFHKKEKPQEGETEPRNQQQMSQ